MIDIMGSRSRRGLSLAALGLMVSMSIPLSSRPSLARPDAIELAGRTTIVAVESGWTRVRLPAPAHISLGFAEDLQNLEGVWFDRGPQLAAVVLAPDVDQPAPLTAVRLPNAEGRIARVVAFGPDLCNVEPSCRLPAGDYRLYVVMGEGPRVRISLKLRGLQGRTRVSPVNPLQGGASGAATERFVTSPYTGTAASVYGGGLYPELRGTYGMAFAAYWFHGSEDPVAEAAPADKPLLQVGSAGTCFYGERPSEETAFLPGCPGGLDRGGNTALRVVDHYRMLQWNQEVGLGPGSYGLGGYVVHTGIFDPGIAGFWLDLR